MKDSTHTRAAMFFGVLGVLLVALVGRLAYLQVFRASANRAVVDRQRETGHLVPAARGTIVDREGRLLAFDRPVMEVRAEAYFDPGGEVSFEQFAGRLADQLAEALAADRELRGRRDVLLGRIAGSSEDSQRLRRGQKIDFLVDRGLESSVALWRLRQLDEGRSSLHLHFTPRQRRTYPQRGYTIGPVGFVGERDLGDGRSQAVYRGMEAFVGLRAGEDGARRMWRDVGATRYWTAISTPPDTPSVLETTLDLDLQRAAHEELRRAVDAVVERYGSEPEWGALCLAQVETGDVLAMASYREGIEDQRIAAFSPTQCICPPGSVVKPLVFALALERGVLDWDEAPIDCQPTSSLGWKVPEVRRWIQDAHDCGALSPREILVQSSNIGAAKVGRRLGREGIIELVERFGLGTPTATRLKGEKGGTVHPGVDELRRMPERRFMGYAAPSLSYGYGCNITPLQTLRAYVSLLAGRPRELRLQRRVVVGGQVTEVPPAVEGPRFLSEDTVAKVVDAMRGVVSDTPGATGRHLAAELARKGADGLVAGKTGTSEYDEIRQGRSVTIRTASFAGFAPADRPELVVICVLQKPEADRFWGGMYAAPAAGRLLLRALSPPAGRSVDPQVSVDSPMVVSLPVKQQ